MGRWSWNEQKKGNTNLSGNRSWSNYWLGDFGSFDDDNFVVGKKADTYDNGVEIGRIFKLQNIRNGIANFVKILSGKDIPVRYSSGQQSYTDGDVVTISASTNPAEFDAMVGVALHEASHVLLSSFLFVYAKTLKIINKRQLTKTTFVRTSAGYQPHNEFGMFFEKYKDFYTKKFPNQMVSDDMRGDVKLTRDIHLVLNVLEDRHIDDYVYRVAPGYRPYYDEMYLKYFFNPEVAQFLRSPEARVQSVTNYLNLLINLHTGKVNLDSMPGLREIEKIVDLPNIRRYDNDGAKWAPIFKYHKDTYPAMFMQESFIENHVNSYMTNLFATDTKDMPRMLIDAVRILSIIYDNANTHEQNNPPEPSDYTDDGNGGETDMPNFDHSDGGDGEGDNAPGDGEGNETQRELSPSEKKRLAKKMAQQRRFVRGEMKKRTLDDKEASMMSSIEASKATLENVDIEMKDGTRLSNYKCSVLVLHEVNARMLKAHQIPSIGSDREQPYSKDAVAEGVKLGSVLAHRLRIMNDESTMKFTRQDHGRIDKRLIASLGMDNDKVFSTESIVLIDPVMVDISLDASGSMAGDKWKKALALAAALCYVSTKVRNLRVRVTMRTTGHLSQGGTAVVAIIYDSAKDKFEKVRGMWPLLYPNGSTPEGLCYAAILDEILAKTKQNRRYFVNVSDGEPAFSTHEFNYSGRPAHEHTRKIVNEIRKAGIKVMGYYVSSRGEAAGRHEGFEIMYGKDAQFINVSQISEIARTLNKLFVSE